MLGSATIGIRFWRWNSGEDGTTVKASVAPWRLPQLNSRRRRDREQRCVLVQGTDRAGFILKRAHHLIEQFLPHGWIQSRRWLVKNK